MCTSSPACAEAPPPAPSAGGFSLLELLLGLGLTLLLAAGLVPAWASFQNRATGASDHVVGVVAARVALARLERDLRLASAAGSSTLAGAPLLEATPTELVVLTRDLGGAAFEIVEWEAVGGRLMRRRAVWTGSVPVDFSHGLYRDHKTVLEGLPSEGALFSYRLGAFDAGAPIAPADLPLVTAVAVRGSVRPAPAAGSIALDRILIVGR